MNRKVDEIYQDILQQLKVVIERDFRPCDLEEPLKTILYDISYKATKENWTGWKIVVSGVFWAVELAHYYAKRYNKSLCHYLDKALKNGWIEHWVLSFRNSFRGEVQLRSPHQG